MIATITPLPPHFDNYVPLVHAFSLPSSPVSLGLVAITHTIKSFSLLFLRVVLGSMVETGWDSLAPRAATVKWWGEATSVAFVVWARLDLCLV